MGELTLLLLTPEDLKPAYKLYIDMDGVLCNFDERFEHFSGMLPDEYEEKFGTRRFWHFIDEEIGIKFWNGMKWCSQGQLLWEFVKPYDPILLTSPSKNKVSVEGKLEWIDSHIPGTPVIFRQAKQKHLIAGPGCILVDDREDTIERVREAGGIGIHCPKNTEDMEPIIEKLRRYGYGRQLS